MGRLLHTAIVIFATNKPRPPPAIMEQIMLTTKTKAHTYPTNNGPNCEQQCPTSCNMVFLVVPPQQDIRIVGVFSLNFAPCSLCRFPIIRESRRTVYTMQNEVLQVPETFLANRDIHFTLQVPTWPYVSTYIEFSTLIHTGSSTASTLRCPL